MHAHGAGLASFFKWIPNSPGPVMRVVRRPLRVRRIRRLTQCCLPRSHVPKSRNPFRFPIGHRWPACHATNALPTRKIQTIKVMPTCRTDRPIAWLPLFVRTQMNKVRLFNTSELGVQPANARRFSATRICPGTGTGSSPLRSDIEWSASGEQFDAPVWLRPLSASDKFFIVS